MSAWLRLGAARHGHQKTNPNYPSCSRHGKAPSSEHRDNRADAHLSQSDITGEARRVVCVCVIYERFRETVELVDRLHHWARLADAHSTRMVIWDNGHHGLAVDPGVVEYHSTVNLGFGRAVNRAAANRPLGSVLLLINPDLELSDSEFVGLIRSARALRPKQIWGPSLVNPDGTPQTAGPLDMETPTESILGTFGVKFRVPCRHHQYVRGAALALEVDAFSEVGGFDERFFLYGEEADICARLVARGYELAVDNAINIRHRGSQGYVNKSPRAISELLIARVLLAQKFYGPRRARAVHYANCAAVRTTLAIQKGRRQARLVDEIYRERAVEIAEWSPL